MRSIYRPAAHNELNVWLLQSCIVVMVRTGNATRGVIANEHLLSSEEISSLSTGSVGSEGAREGGGSGEAGEQREQREESPASTDQDNYEPPVVSLKCIKLRIQVLTPLIAGVINKQPL